MVFGVALSVLLGLAVWAVPQPSRAAGASAPTPQAGEVLARPDRMAAAVTARLTGKRVEVSGERSETTRVWALPNGTFEAEIFAGPVRFRRDGSWVDVDLTLVRGGDGSVAPRAHPFGLRLSGASAGATDLARLGEGGQQVSLGWPAGLPQPVLSGTTATYAGVWPGVDLVVEVTRTGFEQFLVVHSRAAAAQVAQVTLPVRAAGAQVAADPAGGLLVRDAAGQPLGSSPAPVMWDASTDPISGRNGRHTAVATTVTAAPAGGVDLALRPDLAFITDPETVFPVTIDPQVTLGSWFDTFVQSDLTTDQSGSTELRIGTPDGGATVARSFLRWPMDQLSGKQILSATVHLWNSAAGSCGPAGWQVWTTGPVNTSTRWTSQPLWDDLEATSTQTAGYAGCAAGWVSGDAQALFQRAADGGYAKATMGLRAVDETSSAGWKVFASDEAAANNPYVIVNYNGKPAMSGLHTTPAVAGCVTGAGRPYIASARPQLAATVTDGEASPSAVTFQWSVAGGAVIGEATVSNVASGATATTTVPAGAFTEGGSYSWRAKGNDGSATGPWSAKCEFTVDTTTPAVGPGVSSTGYPAGAWALSAGQPGLFSLSAGGVADVAAYLYGLDSNPPTTTVAAPTVGGSVDVTLTPADDGPHTLNVRSADRAGNLSPVTSYQFYVGAGGVTSPGTGDVTAAKLALEAVAPAATSGVTFQWRRGDADPWVSIPAGHVTVAAGGGAVSWPVAGSGGVFPKLIWDVEATLAAADAGLVARDGPLQLRASLTGGAGGTASPVKVSFDRSQASAAASQVGPGSVNLITGNYTVTGTDAAASGMGVGRAFNSRRPGGTDPMFGPGWVSSIVVGQANAPYTKLNAYDSLVQITLPAGDTVGFTKSSVTGNGATYDPPLGVDGLTLTYTTSSDSYTLTDDAGGTVTFTRAATDPAGQYAPTAATPPGSETTSYAWEKATVDGQDVVRPTRVLLPVPAGASCTPTLVRGCRAVTFDYAAATTATGTTEPGWGDYLGRVREVSFTAWDPDLPTPAMRTVIVPATPTTAPAGCVPRGTRGWTGPTPG